MKKYLVGGAVRDGLLGLPVKERDWVVVGATPEVLIKQGYLPVGQDFPVFLHPETKEEYALARTERKVGRGYKGFTFYAEPDVTLEQDLARRDLTMNAIALDEDGKLIDPYGGEQDIKDHVLRHVSPAFAEDPVRILRLARFAARFSDFQVHAGTQQLMENMVASGEVDALVPERVWQEMVRALREKAAARFFEILDDCGALPIVFPGLTLERMDLAALNRAIAQDLPETLRFAALLHTLSEDALKALCKSLRVPKAYMELAVLVVRYVNQYQVSKTLSAEALLNFFERADAFRRPERFAQLLAVCAVIDGVDTVSIPAHLMKAYYAASAVPIKPLMDSGFEQAELAKALHKARCDAMTKRIDKIS